MTVHTPEQLAHEQRRYLQVFAWLVVLTAVELAVIAAAAGAGVVFLTANLLAGGTPVYSAHNNNEVEIAALYWHFVDLIWILVFTFVYLI